MNTYKKTIPSVWYHDAQVFNLERKEIFAREWIYAAEEDDLKNTGDFKRIDIAGYPLVLVRGEDHEIRAFHNTCRHRAAPLVSSDQGKLKGCALTCRYHGWTYDLKGSLVQAPFFDTAELKRNCDVSLHTVKTGSYQGMVFVNLDSGAPAFEEAFGPIRNKIEESKYPMTEYRKDRYMVKEGNFNWKVWMDGFQECYHCFTIHPLFNKEFNLRNYSISTQDGYSVHSCDRKSESTLGGFEGLWLWRFPNLGLPCYEPCSYRLQVNPINSKQTRLSYRFRFHTSVTSEEQDQFIQTIEKITLEDITICEEVQRNLEVGIYENGVLNPDRENGVEYFHSLVRRAIGGKLCKNESQ